MKHTCTSYSKSSTPMDMKLSLVFDLHSLVSCSVFLVVNVVLLVLVRAAYLVRWNGLKTATKRKFPCRTMIVLGSGGHTSEMIRIVGGLRLKSYSPRLYVAATGDEMSQKKAKGFETTNGTFGAPSVSIKTIPRARKVLQSYFTSIFTTLVAIFSSFWMVLQFRPDLVLCNGPGTCVPICFWAYLLKFFCLKETRIVYVESLCRVQKLSLSGLLLYYLYLADHIYVQWPRLKELYPRTSYIGRVL